MCALLFTLVRDAIASREYCVIGWSLKSRGARSGSIQQTSPLEPLKRQRESQERIPMTLLKAKRNSCTPLYSSPCRRMFNRLGFLVIYLKASSKTDPPLSLHTARVGSSVNYGREVQQGGDVRRTVPNANTHTRVFVCVYDCTFTCSIAVPGGWASVIVLKSFPLAKSHIVI